MPRSFLRALLFALPMGAVACRGGGAVNKNDGAALHCTVQAPTTCPQPFPVYADVQPIFARRCNPCHNGLSKDGPWPLKSYEEITSWYDDVRSYVLTCQMPPPDSGVDISDEERLVILQWLRCDYPLTADAGIGPTDGGHDASGDSAPE